MIYNNLSFYGAKILGELVYDVLYFPVWWYSKGLLQILKMLKNFLADKQKSLALIVWIKNIFRPMYGQYDWAGVLISFFMRTVQIFFRSIVMFFYLFFAIVVFCFWLILPIFVVYEIIFQLAL